MKSYRLGDLIAVKHGFAFPGSYFSSDPAFPVLVTPGNFSIRGGFQERDKTFTGDIPKGYELQPGDLIITMTDLSKFSDTLGVAAIVPDTGKRYLHNQRIGKVTVTRPDLVDLRFLSYYLRTDRYRDHIVGTASGSTVRHTSPGRIEAFFASLPERSEQMAIAAVLSALDDKVTANLSLASTAGELALSHAATAPLTCPLSEIAQLDRTTIRPNRFATKTIWTYSLPAFDAGATPASDSPSDIKSAKFWMETPRVLISKLNPRIPRIWAVDKTTGLPGLASTEFMPVVPKAVSYEVLWATVSGPEFGRRLEAQVAGTSGSHQRVRPEDLMATEVADPRLLSTRTIDLVDSLVSLGIQARSENGTLRELRDTLLPALMSGRLRVKDAERQVEDAV